MTTALPLNHALLTDIEALRGIIDAVPHPVFVKDDDTRFVVVNDMMCKLMQRRYDELIGRRDEDFVPREQADVFRGNDLRVLNTGETNENEELFLDGDGRLRTIVTRKKRLVLANGARLLVGCITDISDFRRAEALIRHNAEHDALTGLANRRFFYDRVGECLARSAQSGATCAILLIDLDRFKPINDAHGHTAGDLVLCAVASRLRGIVRKADTVARLGGDEFAVITEGNRGGGSTPQGAARLAARIIAGLGKPIMVAGVTVEVGCSIGIAQCPADGTTAEALLHAADVAMYRAKRDGRGKHCFFEPRMDAELREQAALEADFRHAVAAGAIEPYYQPLVSLSDGRLLGFEILARWNDTVRGFVPPDVFIPLAEKLGLISSLTSSLLRRAAHDALAWPSDLTLSLNISPTQLTDSLLPMEILAVLNEAGFPAGRLEIEITENALVADLPAAKAILDSFQNLGIKVALDDFGTGYSSLHHLRELNFDKLKIDRSFVQSMRSNPESAKIVNAILGLARSMGLPTTAEGIEDPDVLAELAEGGAEYGQGYYFGRAVPAAEVGSIIDGRTATGPRRAAG